MKKYVKPELKILELQSKQPIADVDIGNGTWFTNGKVKTTVYNLSIMGETSHP